MSALSRGRRGSGERAQSPPGSRRLAALTHTLHPKQGSSSTLLLGKKRGSAPRARAPPTSLSLSLCASLSLALATPPRVLPPALDSDSLRLPYPSPAAAPPLLVRFLPNGAALLRRPDDPRSEPRRLPRAFATTAARFCTTANSFSPRSASLLCSPLLSSRSTFFRIFSLLARSPRRTEVASERATVFTRPKK